MNQAEDLTRRAARAIGKDVSLFEWDGISQCLRLNSFGQPTFGPLTLYADAYMIETALNMNVHYRTNGTTISIHASCEKHPMIHMVSVPKDSPQDALVKARMRLAVTYAALVEIAERENG